MSVGPSKVIAQTGLLYVGSVYSFQTSQPIINSSLHDSGTHQTNTQNKVTTRNQNKTKQDREKQKQNTKADLNKQRITLVRLQQLNLRNIRNILLRKNWI